MSDVKKWIELEGVDAIRGTAAAVLCDFGALGEVWIPKSQIHDDSEVQEEGDFGVLCIPDWLARKKGLVGE